MRVVITGTGTVSSIGNTTSSFWGNLIDGNCGFKPISLFDTTNYTCNLAAESSHYDPTLFIDQKSLFKYDRIQLLTLGAAHMAWADAQLADAPYDPRELGVVMGATYGYIDSVSNFYMESLKEGPAYVSPVSFTNTVMNAPSGKIAIEFKLTGLSSTIATGMTSGLDAIQYGCDFIRSGKCKAILVGAGSVLSEILYMGLYHSGCLSGSRNNESEFCIPFDAQGNGFIIGEGAGVLVLENLEYALDRGATILAEIKGYASNFSAALSNNEDGLLNSQSMVMQTAISDSQIAPEMICAILANANSTYAKDAIEAAAIARVFNDKAPETPVTAIKAATGECLDASALLQVIAAICSIEKNTIPGIRGLTKPIDHYPLNYVIQNQSRPVDHVLCNSFSNYGKNTSLVIGKYNGK